MHELDPSARSRDDKRKEKRFDVNLKGKVFDLERGFEDDCVVVDLSPEGARIRSALPWPLGTHIVLYVTGFGRFEGSVVQRDENHLGLQFQSGVVKQRRTAEQLANFAYDKQVSPVPLRSAVRTAQLPPLQRFIGSDGSEAACEVVDIALGGVALKTDARPAIGALLRFGDVVGRVVRHTDDGVAVEFMGKKPAAG